MASKWLSILGCLTLVLFVLAISVSSSNSNDDGLVRYKRQASDVTITSAPSKTSTGGASLKATKPPKKKGKKNKKGKKKNPTTEGVPIETEATESEIVTTVKTPETTDDWMQGIAAVPQVPP